MDELKRELQEMREIAEENRIQAPTAYQEGYLKAILDLERYIKWRDKNQQTKGTKDLEEKFDLLLKAPGSRETVVINMGLTPDAHIEIEKYCNEILQRMIGTGKNYMIIQKSEEEM